MRFYIIYTFIFILSLLFLPQITAEVQSDYTIDKSTVYINDSKAYISAFPHTIYSKNNVTFTIKSKQFSGDVDVFVGFPTDVLIPKKAFYHSPYNVNVTYSYNFTGVTDYEISTEECEKGGGNNKYKVYHSPENITIACFDSYENTGDNYTIYWQEEKTIEYKEFTKSWNSVDYNYADMDKWYYLKNVNINSGQFYKFMVTIQPLKETKQKYSFAIKPSSMSLQKAISNNALYLLDPWALDTTLTDPTNRVDRTVASENYIIVGDRDGNIYIYYKENRSLYKEHDVSSSIDQVVSIDVNNDETKILAGGRSETGAFAMFNLDSGSLISQIMDTDLSVDQVYFIRFVEERNQIWAGAKSDEDYASKSYLYNTSIDDYSSYDKTQIGGVNDDPRDVDYCINDSGLYGIITFRYNGVRLFDETLTQISTVVSFNDPTAAQFKPDTDCALLAITDKCDIGGGTCKAYLYDVNGTAIYTSSQYGNNVDTVAYDPYGRFFAVGDRGGNIDIYNTTDTSSISVIETFTDPSDARGLHFDAYDPYLISGENSNPADAYVYDTEAFPSCIYSGSGDWVITDNCTGSDALDTNTDIGSNDFIINSGYIVESNADITAQQFNLKSNTKLVWFSGSEGVVK